jgi:dnd system-associated protein 4
MRRIQRDVCHEEFVKSLTTGEAPLFREIWRLLLFAAALGIQDGNRRPLNKMDSGKAMPETYFSAPAWRGLLYLIGVAESGDSQCLRGTSEAQDSLITAFEEYANQGLFLLRERVQSPGYPLDDFISLLQEAIKPEVSSPVIDDLI